jgi:hypothetical protein
VFAPRLTLGGSFCFVYDLSITDEGFSPQQEVFWHYPNILPTLHLAMAILKHS